MSAKSPLPLAPQLPSRRLQHPGLSDCALRVVATVVKDTTLSNAASNGAWSEGVIGAAGRLAVNKSGTTQLRVYFNLDDNDDARTDYIGYYSGDNATPANRPQLVVTYQ